MVSSVRTYGDPTYASTVDFRVTFSRSVTGVDVSDFTLTTTLDSDAAGTSRCKLFQLVCVGLGGATNHERPLARLHGESDGKSGRSERVHNMDKGRKDRGI